jgi:L-arabinose isomerase
MLQNCSWGSHASGESSGPIGMTMDFESKHLRVGLLGIGLDAYWPQFEGLRERLDGYLSEIAQQIEGPRRTILSLGLVDSMDAAVWAGHECRRRDIDLLLIYAATYALSATVLPVVQRAGVPILLLNLQPEEAMDYSRFNRLGDRTTMTGEWLAWCGGCPIPEIANVLLRLQIRFFQVTGALRNDPACRAELEGWLQAAEVVKALAHSRMGLMGHVYGGMLDVATDLAQISGRFGLLLEMLEVDELTALRLAADAPAVAARRQQLQQTFEIREDCPEEELSRAAQTSVALDRMVADHRLDLLAYYYKGSGIAANQDTMSSIILGTSALTARGIPVAGEYEIKNAIAMKILDLLGAGGAFTEFYAMDYTDDVVLMGHDGPGHPAIAQGPVRVRPLDVYHGKTGRGLSVEMSVRHGPVTLLSVVEHRDAGFQLLIAEGQSVPGTILKIGNTNSRYRFPLGARGFIEAWNSHGPAHHCAIGVGHLGSQLKKIADLAGLPAVRIC